jgi:hypothetical protein
MTLTLTQTACVLKKNCSLSSTPARDLNRSLQQKHLEIKAIASQAKHLLNDLKRPRIKGKRGVSEGSLSDDDVTSVASFITARFVLFETMREHKRGKYREHFIPG